MTQASVRTQSTSNSPLGGSPYPSLRSMTGQGRGEASGNAGAVVTEIRSVNNRGLKVILRTSDSVSELEPKIETLIRQHLHRGSVTVQVRLTSPPGADLPRVNCDAVRSYAEQLAEVADSLAMGDAVTSTNIDLAHLMQLPGVLESPSPDGQDTQERQARAQAKWELVESSVELALERFKKMRSDEAIAMAESIEQDLQLIETRCEQVAKLSPFVVQRYRERLRDRIEKAFAENNLQPAQPVDLIREVQLFADRADISEELTRLKSHLAMMRGVLVGDSSEESASTQERGEAVGRKLDFIIQELNRETNTIGSKAGDAEIAEHVVEMKCAIERMRELVQNLE
ncbi:YicC family protein [Rhodopirellula sp. JC740]|uniref:YicC family protein n=1 Tax=Rhodopirellula halodulae TaxID=2894198 RepID=A0ABS8NCF1_9BACT|nr:YicC family protein [Rhodopirellula sp. JC740]